MNRYENTLPGSPELEEKQSLPESPMQPEETGRRAVDQETPYRIRCARLKAARMLGTHTESEWYGLVERFGFRCLRCLRKKRIEKDHIIPIYQGGSDAISNLQPLCKSCNASKGPDNCNWVKIREREMKNTTERALEIVAHIFADGRGREFFPENLDGSKNEWFQKANDLLKESE